MFFHWHPTSCSKFHSLLSEIPRLDLLQGAREHKAPLNNTHNIKPLKQIQHTHFNHSNQGNMICVIVGPSVVVVSAHRRILGMALVVCVLVKICVSSISLYKLDTDKLATPDSKTVPGRHYNLCSNPSFVLTD